MSTDNSRLLLEIERSMRAVNLETINPQITALTLDDVRPVLCMVANARARYLKALFDLGDGQMGSDPDTRPTTAQFDELKQLRNEYDELLDGAQALEVAIQRGYLDVKVD